MKLYTAERGSNPQKVRIFLAEKGLELPSVFLDLMKNEQRSAEYLKINSLGTVPSLVLDDGTIITESVAICRFVEERYPEPPLFGTDAKSRALIEMWIRRAELEISRPCSDVVQHTAEFFAEKVDQNAEFARSQRQVAAQKFAWLDQEIGGRDFLAGTTFSMADIVAYTAVGLAKMMRIDIPEDLANFERWFTRVSSRPSISA